MEKNQKFKTGDRVILSSGGPVMTVVKYDGEEVICMWFDKNTPHERAFHQDIIELHKLPSFF